MATMASSPDQSAIVVCATCGMPVRVVFAPDGEVEKVLAVCSHIEGYVRDAVVRSARKADRV